MALPEPPYTYNDPRLTYGEHCFLWNGGYDTTCLILGFNRKKRVGGSSGPASKTIKEKILPWIDISVSAQLIELNDEVYDGERVVQGARGELNHGTITSVASRVEQTKTGLKITAEGNEVVSGNRFLHTNTIFLNPETVATGTLLLKTELVGVALAAKNKWRTPLENTLSGSY